MRDRNAEGQGWRWVVESLRRNWGWDCRNLDFERIINAEACWARKSADSVGTGGFWKFWGQDMFNRPPPPLPPPPTRKTKANTKLKKIQRQIRTKETHLSTVFATFCHHEISGVAEDALCGFQPNLLDGRFNGRPFVLFDWFSCHFLAENSFETNEDGHVGIISLSQRVDYMDVLSWRNMWIARESSVMPMCGKHRSWQSIHCISVSQTVTLRGMLMLLDSANLHDQCCVNITFKYT